MGIQINQIKTSTKHADCPESWKWYEILGNRLPISTA